MSISSLVTGASSGRSGPQLHAGTPLASSPVLVGLTRSIPSDSHFDWSRVSQSDDWTTQGTEAKRKRATRVVYTEEQKFFIMYARVVQGQAWVDIEDCFAEIFGQRSKDGLTSMYYRIRRSWGLKDILKNGPESYVEDKQVVYEKAAFLSQDFLLSVGYLP